MIVITIIWTCKIAVLLIFLSCGHDIDLNDYNTFLHNYASQQYLWEELGWSHNLQKVIKLLILLNLM